MMTQTTYDNDIEQKKQMLIRFSKAYKRFCSGDTNFYAFMSIEKNSNSELPPISINSAINELKTNETISRNVTLSKPHCWKYKENIEDCKEMLKWSLGGFFLFGILAAFSTALFGVTLAQALPGVIAYACIASVCGIIALCNGYGLIKNKSKLEKKNSEYKEFTSLFESLKNDKPDASSSVTEKSQLMIK
jgi:hypothetical protein